ncbi:MAG: trypsin-like peptidase domain-containing protein [Eubacterium sp.]|nr:trypsin-like peptidase domain-containing protein [Eubacterium sp.]
MSEFENENEYYTPPQPTESGNTEPPAEENTTYHFSYKRPEEPAYSASQQSNYYTPPFSNETEKAYSDPQPNAYSAQYQQETAHGASVNGEPVDPAPKKKNKTVTVLVSAFVACLIFAVVGLFASMGSNDPVIPPEEGSTNTTQQVQIQQPNTPSSTNSDGSLSVKGVTDKCINSCVGITVYTQQTSYSNFFGYGSGSQGNSEEVKSGEGSGVLMLEANGRTYVMTCAHVISDGTSFVVTLNDKTEYKATLVGYDAQTDIGVLAINATGLQIAEFGDSDKAAQGEQVVAIGCPGGLRFLNSTAVGFISALGRPVSPIGYNMECIQVDAAINPGNSGGALFNMYGQVIGITSSKIAATDYEGMGFAVPSNTAVNTANSLIRVGYVEGRAMIGITYKAITTYSNSDAIINALAQLGYENAYGTMVINTIREESDLSTKDVKAYDMIVAINGKTLTSTDIVTSALSNSKPGDTVKLTMARIQNNQIDTFEIECKLIENKGN